MESEWFLWTCSMNLGKSLSLTEPRFCLQNTKNIVLLRKIILLCTP